MGTQTNVKFSRMSLPIRKALETLRDDAFDPLQIELRKFSRIQPTGEVDFPGYDAIGKLLNLRTVDEVMNEVGRGESFALSYLVGVPAFIYLNFFDFAEDGYSMLLTFDSSLLYFTDDNNEAGELLERILSRIVTSLHLDACGYNTSDRYAQEFDALSVDEIVQGLRSRELLQLEPPFYYAIKTDHLSTSEVRALSNGTHAAHKMYRKHHVLCA